MSEPITWDDLDRMVEDDPLKLRDRAWREIRTRDMELSRQRPVIEAAKVMAATARRTGDLDDACNEFADVVEKYLDGQS